MVIPLAGEAAGWEDKDEEELHLQHTPTQQMTLLTHSSDSKVIMRFYSSIPYGTIQVLRAPASLYG